MHSEQPFYAVMTPEPVQSSRADVLYRSGSKDGASPGSGACGLVHDNFVFILLTVTHVDLAFNKINKVQVQFYHLGNSSYVKLSRSSN